MFLKSEAKKNTLRAHAGVPVMWLWRLSGPSVLVPAPCKLTTGIATQKVFQDYFGTLDIFPTEACCAHTRPQASPRLEITFILRISAQRFLGSGSPPAFSRYSSPGSSLKELAHSRFLSFSHLRGTGRERAGANTNHTAVFSFPTNRSRQQV